MDKVLGLDVGTKRIGVAVSDALRMFSHPHGVVFRKSDKQAAEEIKKIAAELQSKIIVIGLPRNMDGTLGPQAEDCKTFSEYFINEFEIAFEDETLSSFEAENFLRQNKKKYTKNKHLVDIASACIILQQYLDRK